MFCDAIVMAAFSIFIVVCSDEIQGAEEGIE